MTIGRWLRAALALFCVCVVAPTALVVMAGTPAQAAEPGDNYPSKWKTHPGGCDVDDWGYCATWCTSWVAWALHDRNKFEMPRAIGNANAWGTWASRHGYAVNSTPAVGAVYWTTPGYGHVAWVSAISGSKVTLQEYNGNYTDFRYRSRTITATSSTKFIHFKDLSLVKSKAPSISGTAKVGSKLTANKGTWKSTSGSSPGATITYKYQWLANGSTISGATSSTYTPTSSMAGKKISVKVTVAASGYKGASATTGQTGAVAPSTMTNTARPSISGQAVVGSVLTAVSGTWSPGPDSTSYQWFAGGSAIAGATGSTLTLTGTQLGAAITVRQTAVRAGYATSVVESSPTAPVSGTATSPSTLTSTAPPTITGDAVVGAVLTAISGAWSPTPDSTSYQWYAGGSAIAGATASTLTLTDDQVGLAIVVQQTASKAGYAAGVAASPPTRPVVGTDGGSSLIAPMPTISGSAVYGSTLTAEPGTWSPQPVTLSYQWKRDSSAITGATKASYVLDPADIGHRLSVTVTGSKDGYATVSQTSAATTTVSAATLTAPTPTISGDAQQGHKLRANSGTWTAKAKLAYQWNRSGSAIGGATSSTYTPSEKDVGKTITVTVTGSLSGYVTAARTSKATATIASTRWNTDPYSSGCAGNVYNLSARSVSGGTAYIMYSRTCGTNWIEYRGNSQTVSKRLKDSVTDRWTRTETDTLPWSYSMQVSAPGNTSIVAEVKVGSTTYTARCSTTCSWTT